ncbi:amidohydrolase [Anaerotignum propionicum]|uniref:amidohydrolase n=1 Tax=Anaerotignum propionicum TaxID=28446 RepID=UPI0028A207AB|nr:amidohydrolase [Anaerotignum propionicum]
MITKEELLKYLEKERQAIFQRGDAFFQCAELGFCEVETARRITDLLEEWGIPYEKEVALTGVIATLGKGDGYHIAFVADIDALPRKDGKGNIHSCGHSIQTTMGLSLLKALHDSGILEQTDCKVRFYFTPAEEYIDFEYRDELIAAGKLEFRSGKQNMISLGCFDGVDCVLSTHANGDERTKFDVSSTLAGFMAKKAVFMGRAAHSGAAPHLGRNTLHGATLAMNAISFLKDQFAVEKGLRLNPVLTVGGGSVNTIPDETVLETYVRANDNETLFEACRRFDGCVEHCAKALDLEYKISNTAGYLPLAQSKGLNKVVRENMLLHCSSEEIVESPVSGASGDVGDLGFLIPTIQFGFSGVRGRFHDDSFEISDYENCYITSGKVMLGTIYDLIMKPNCRVQQNKKKYDVKKLEYFGWLHQKLD